MNKEEFEKNASFRRELAGLINKYSREKESNTPDFILADFIIGCLEAYEAQTMNREKWYGRA